MAFVVGLRPVLWALGSFADDPASSEDVLVPAGLLVWAAQAALCTAGALLGLGLALRGSGRVRPTQWRAAVLLPATGALTAVGAVAYARSTGYSTDGSIVLLELTLVLAGVVAALAASRAWAVHGALDGR